MEKRDMLIKVCGMREAENIAEVEALGIDFMGFICWSKSPRALTEVPEHLPTACRRVGVFVNETVQGIVERVASLGLNAIQLHGNETPDLCRELRALPALQGVDIFKAFRIAEAKDLEVCEAYADSCRLFVFDTKCACYGGSGEQFDWSVLEHYKAPVPFLLSGGIGPESIEALANFSHPQWRGVDLNSRFETAPGHKDAHKLKEFISRFRQPN
jgi:phosphoribosylanthranilate isomerase